MTNETVVAVVTYATRRPGPVLGVDVDGLQLLRGPVDGSMVEASAQRVPIGVYARPGRPTSTENPSINVRAARSEPVARSADATWDAVSPRPPCSPRSSPTDAHDR